MRIANPLDRVLAHAIVKDLEKRDLTKTEVSKQHTSMAALVGITQDKLGWNKYLHRREFSNAMLLQSLCENRCITANHHLWRDNL